MRVKLTGVGNEYVESRTEGKNAVLESTSPGGMSEPLSPVTLNWAYPAAPKFMITGIVPMTFLYKVRPKPPLISP